MEKIINLIKDIIIGIIQGISEILPISSSAHLAITYKLLSINNQNQFNLTIFLHFASCLALCIFFKDELIDMIVGFIKYVFKKDKTCKDSFMLFVYLIITIISNRLKSKSIKKQIEKLEEENARGKFASFVSKAQDIEGGKLFISKVEAKPLGIKIGLEFLSQKLGDSIIVLAGPTTVAVKVSDNFVKQGVNAGKIVGEIARATGANGGGRPNFAQGGVKDASKLDEILTKIEEELKAVKV